VHTVLQMIVSSSLQTKQWRKNQEWYRNGKHNECENYQVSCIEDILQARIEKTNHLRLNRRTNQFCRRSNPMAYPDGFDYTEDFDRWFEYGDNIILFNLKFVCDQGGAQTRSLREASHFIEAQCRYISSHPGTRVYFMNILDGDESFRKREQFNHTVAQCACQTNMFVGDLMEFKEYWSVLTDN